VKPTTAGASLSHEHPALIEVALAVIRQLAGVSQSLAGSSWHDHHEYAKRAAHLSEHLGAAIALATSRRYASASAVARIALEQGYVDELLLLADRYREKIAADLAAYREPEAEWQRGEADWADRSGQFERVVRVFDEGIDPDAADTRDERFEFGLECVLIGVTARIA
jgi:hypothetical protein